MALDQGQQDYEGLFGKHQLVYLPETTFYTRVPLEEYYITQPLFIMPKKVKNENYFRHDLISDRLPADETIATLRDKVLGYTFSDATLTYVDPLFVSTFADNSMNILAMNPEIIEFKTLNEKIKFYESLIKDFELRILSKDAEQDKYEAEKRIIENKIQQHRARMNELTNQVLPQLTSIPLLTNHIKTGVAMDDLFNTMYFIIETESSTKTKTDGIIYMTRELFVSSSVGSSLFDKQAEYAVNTANKVQPQTIVRMNKDNQQNLSYIIPLWKRGKLLRYNKSVSSLNLSGTFVLDGIFLSAIDTENDGNLFDFEIYIAYSKKSSQTSLVWRNPISKKLVPITILVASSVTTERMRNLNIDPKEKNWPDTLIIGAISLTQVLYDIQDNVPTYLANSIMNIEQFSHTFISLPNVVFELDQRRQNASTIYQFLNFINTKITQEYKKTRDDAQDQGTGHAFDPDIDNLEIKEIYSYNTMVMMFEEMIASNFVQEITKRHHVIQQRRILDAYNSYKIETTLSAKLDTDTDSIPLKKKTFSNGHETFSTQKLNLQNLFENGEMYFLIMKNKAALIVIRHVTPAGIVIEAGDQVQILNKTDYDNGVVFEIIKNGEFSLDITNKEGAILVDPKFQWDGEFVFVSNQTFLKAKENLKNDSEKGKVVSNAENLLRAISNAHSTSQDKFKFAVVQEIYHAKFIRDTPSPELGKIKGGLGNILAQRLNGLGKGKK